MRAIVSIPGPLFREAERLRKKLKISRSELYLEALERYLRKHQQSKVTRRLNEALKDVDTRLDPLMARLQSRALLKEKW